MKLRAVMSSSPVELLEGWRLNQTRGLSLLATVVVDPLVPVLPEGLASPFSPTWGRR